MRVNFEEVKITASKTGSCPACGKKATRSKAFWQTVSQFNTNAAGQRKTKDEIRQELAQQAGKWKTEPVYHSRCE